jgi:glycosyltransferase involved in cell wall biosynthesis
VGPAERESLARLQETLARLGGGELVRYVGPVSEAELPKKYAESDIFVFASTCENMPNILLEAMASGLPIASSRRGPMPEVLGDAGVYFEPEDPADIAAAVRKLVTDADLRRRCARGSLRTIKQYTWSRCASETLGFLRRVYERHQAQHPTSRLDGAAALGEQLRP